MAGRDDSYSARQGRRPSITTDALIELVFRKLREFERHGYFSEIFATGDDHDRVGDPEQYVITRLGRPGLFRWLGDLERVVHDRDFPDWDEDTLLDVVELYHDVIQSPTVQREFRSSVNEALGLREPPLALDVHGRITSSRYGGSTTAGLPGLDARKEYDVYISYASEDAAAIAQPLAERLKERGHRVFYDKFELVAGDHLIERIDHGLRQSRRAVVILSRAFFAKEWPRRELDSLTTLELASGENLIIPIWHGVTAGEVARFSASLGDRLAITSAVGIDAVVAGIERALERRPTGGAPAVSPAAFLRARRRRALRPHAVSHLRRIPGVGWLRQREPRIADLLVIAVVGAVVTFLLTAGGDSNGKRPAQSPDSHRGLFSAVVDANVVHPGGAQVRTSARLASSVTRLAPARRTRCSSLGFVWGSLPLI